MAAFGFFFLPILEIKPNRLASGLPINLLEIPGDFRYIALFLLALVPLVVAFQEHRGRRGWALVGIGNLVMFLTLLLPAVAGIQLLEEASTFFEEGTRISNPRIFTSSAIALGLLGGYIISFGGIIDLQQEKVSRVVRLIASLSGPIFILLLILSGGADIYSILVEFEQRGELLGQRFVEHFVFVIVSLIAGLIIGIALGLWASRDKRAEPVILNAVGIIQTIPSLALFGVLLVPLARLGDQPFTNVATLTITLAVIGLIILFGFFAMRSRLPERLGGLSLVAAVIILFVPFSLFVILLISFGFETILTVFRSQVPVELGFITLTLQQLTLLFVVGMLIVLAISYMRRNQEDKAVRQRYNYARIAVGLVAVLLLGMAIVRAAGLVIGTEALADITIRDLGVSGIGTAPAIIALTLYSLLPLVRNTFAGLNNIDPAIIDSGRGMGMTPTQIFFQIELPLAFPVIMAGVRNAGISLVGIAAVASIIGAGALGDFILLGINSTSIDLILLGAIPAIFLAVVLDALLQLFEAIFTSPGIRHVTN